MTIKYLDSKRIQALSGETYYQEADGNSGASMSNGGTYYAYGTEIRAGHSSITKKEADKWTIRFGRNNSPQGVVEAHIYTGTEGATSKTHSQTSTNSITVDALSTSDADYSFTFATPHTISAGDVFAIVWKTDTSTSGSNYIDIKLFNALTDMPNTRNYMVSTANWNGTDDDGHTWSVAPSPYTTYTLTSKLELIAEKTLITNVQDNSILVEKDTGNRYWLDLGVEPQGTSGSGGDWAEVSFNASSAVGGATTSGNTATGGTHWTQYVRSNEYISPSTGGGEIYFTHSDTANVSVGLEKSPFNSTPSAVYTGKDYSFHTTSGGNNMYEGTSYYAGTAWASATNEFRITMDSAGLVKYYWRSGNWGAWTLERTSTVTASGDYYMAVSPASGTTTCFIKGTPVTWTLET